MHLQVDQWNAIGITQIVSLNSCDLFLVILVTHMKQVDYCKIVRENLNFVVKNILGKT